MFLWFSKWALPLQGRGRLGGPRWALQGTQETGGTLAMIWGVPWQLLHIQRFQAHEAIQGRPLVSHFFPFTSKSPQHHRKRQAASPSSLWLEPHIPNLTVLHQTHTFHLWLNFFWTIYTISQYAHPGFCWPCKQQKLAGDKIYCPVSDYEW